LLKAELYVGIDRFAVAGKKLLFWGDIEGTLRLEMGRKETVRFRRAIWLTGPRILCC